MRIYGNFMFLVIFMVFFFYCVRSYDIVVRSEIICDLMFCFVLIAQLDWSLHIKRIQLINLLRDYVI